MFRTTHTMTLALTLTAAVLATRDTAEAQRVRPDGTLFVELDTSNDHRISRAEWRDDRGSFDRIDQDRDGYLTRAEMTAPETVARVQGSAPVEVMRSPSYRAGYQRGMSEGRAAGVEDRQRNQGWDIDGQRELEEADSGYRLDLGPRLDYQAGYRVAFRLGYRDGFGRR